MNPTWEARTGAPRHRPVTGEIIFGPPRKPYKRKLRPGSPEFFAGGLGHVTLDAPPPPEKVREFFKAEKPLNRVGLTREQVIRLAGGVK